MLTDFWWLKPLALMGAGLWLGFGIVRVWLGWGVRRLYAGPPWREDDEERLLPVVCYRVGVATGWTVAVVAALLLLGLLGRTGGGHTVSFTAALSAWLTTAGWWVAMVIFAWNTVWQLEYIWDDLNRAAQD